MTAQLLSSKIIVQEEPPSLRIVQNVVTGVVACSGITARGPIGVSTLLFSFEQFVDIFGADIPNGVAASAARGFFAGGGTRMYFSRVVHYTDITQPSSKTSAAGTLNLLTPSNVPSAAHVTGENVGPFQLTPNDTLVVTRDAGATSTATFTATAASVAGATGPFVLADNEDLVVVIDGGTPRSVVFTSAAFVSIGAATLAEVITAINAVLTTANATVSLESGLKISSRRFGSTSSVRIVGGSAVTPLGLSVSVATGTGNVADIGAVTIPEIKTIVEAAVSGVTVTNSNGAARLTGTVTGPGGLVQVMVASTAADELGLDLLAHYGSSGEALATLRVDARYDGAYSSGVTILITPATSNIAAEFNLSVLVNGSTVERFPNVTMLNTAARFVELVINSNSKYIQVTDLDVNPGAAGAVAERPAPGGGSPALAFGPLTGGNDGLTDSLGATTVAEIDFVGDASSHLGFYAFDLNDDADLLICPEVATSAVHNAALSYCSVTRNGDMFFIADPPAGLGPQQICDYVVTQAAIKESTEHGAIYWPRVKVLNPNPAIFGPSATIIVPPSGHIAGMFARVDGARVGGVYDPPGGCERGQLPGVLGFETDEVLKEAVRDLVAPNLINSITRLRGQPIAVDDVLTLRASGAFPTIAERRGVTFIERSLKDAMQFARLRNNDEDLRDEMHRTVEAFLLSQMRVKAFRSMDPTKAFFVDVGDALNPPSEQFAGRVNCRTGLATQKPARFVILSFAQDTRAIDEELAAAG